jgi:xylan 1,4-beta-xylosidase
MMRNPAGRWWSLNGGRLTLTARPITLGENANPSFVARRQQHIDAEATTAVRFNPLGGGRAGLVALQSDEYWYFLAVARDGAGRPVVELRRRAGPDEPAAGTVIATQSLGFRAGAPVQLRIEARGGSYDFRWSSDGKSWNTLVADADGTILSTKRAGGFVGAMFGLHAYRPPPQDGNRRRN